MARTHGDPLWSEIHEALNQVRFSIWALENGVNRELPRSDLAQRILGEIQLFIQEETNHQTLAQGDHEISVERDTVRYLGAYIPPVIARDNRGGDSDGSVPELEERPCNSRPERPITLTQRFWSNRERCPHNSRGRGNRRTRRARRRLM